MARRYVNRAWMTTATTGTGTVTLGSAVSNAYFTFAEAGMTDTDTATYVILDGTDVEIGVGTYTSAGTTFSRDTVTASRIGGTAGTSKINLSGTATIFLAHKADETAFTDIANSFTATQTIKSTDAGATVGPLMVLHRDSASPAASDILGQLRFDGEDSAGNQQEYASVEATVADTTSTSEDGSLDLYVTIAGARVRFLTAGRNAAGTADANAVGLPKGQLSFPATQNASSDANTLDDYEEGTWTPGMTFNSDATGITYSAQAGTYTKIGRLLTLDGQITLTANGSGVGNARITDTPFTFGGGSVVGHIDLATGGSAATGIYCKNESGTTNLLIFLQGATGRTNATDTNLTNTASFNFSITGRST